MSQVLEKVVIVGAGFFGSVLAERLATAGISVLLLDKRPHVGGNSWSCPDPESGVEEHVYGPHIFHTANARVWAYINQFASFNNYCHHVWARHNGKIYPLPFCLAAINLLLDKVLSPAEARAWVESEAAKEHIHDPANMEEKALSMLGRPLYEAFVKGYSEKQWGCPLRELPASIITRLPVRFNYDTNYYRDIFQGIPVDGYGSMFRAILQHPLIDVRLNTDYFKVRASLPSHDLLVFTGPIDRFFDYRYGRLAWRSIRFEKQVLPIPDFQGNAQINECDLSVPYTRTNEFRHFTPDREFDKTVIHREYPYTPVDDDDVHYPVRTPSDLAMLAKYQADSAALTPRVLFGGRLGTYRYLDMDQSIASALSLSDALLASL